MNRACLLYTSWEALEAAVFAGADAVYLGGSAFGARAYAENFGPEELQRAITFAHLHHVRIYVTVNTLVTDEEMKALGDYVTFLSNIGVDGIIVQDLGIIRLCRRTVPELELHASTQMTITNSAGAIFAYHQGMPRSVMARETTLKDLKTICQKTPGEIETFMHGALCILSLIHILQLGIGGMPNAVGAMIAKSDLKDLSVHTEMYVDGFVDIANAGKLTCAQKNIDKGRQVFTFAAGTKKLYDYVDNNPCLLYTSSVVTRHWMALPWHMMASWDGMPISSLVRA